jgi:cytochrome c oxidase subunit 2
MALTIALVLIVVAAVAFQLLSPWWLTPLASNWGLVDDALLITLVITGIAFAVINIAIALTVFRYRHRAGLRAAYEPHNSKLEWILVGLTSVGIVAMLAPGLWAYNNLITPPNDALTVEILARQWQWRFRFPGKDGVLGRTDIAFVSAQNPFGLNPDDPRGQDDILIDGPELHLPLNRAIKVVQRSQDVIHAFFVPQFRVQIDSVPGTASTYWFMPTRAGRFEILCNEYCGLGHSNMRGYVVVEPQAQFEAWLARRPTFAQTQGTPPAPTDGNDLVALGRELARTRGCAACHSIDGSAGVGPTWKGLYGKTEALVGGGTVKVDDAYLKESILLPQAKIVQGFAPVMPQQNLTDTEVSAIVAFIRTLSDDGAHPASN